jgi:molybdopterin molybdotransferase
MRKSPSPQPTVPHRSAVSIDEARELILASLAPLGSETVGLRDALGRVLAQPVESDRRIPPVDNSAMDGFALRSEDAVRVPARLRVVDEIAAGARPSRKLGPGEAARILTGAPIPEGADAVVMQEHTRLEGDALEVLEAVSPADHVRRAGADVSAGMRVLDPGRVLRPADVGMLSALGRTQIPVMARARVAILATGDELVEPDRLEDDGRIVSSNSYGLQAAVQDAGAEPVLLGIARDEPDAIAESFRRALRCDVVVSTGGVSVGDRDWIKSVLADLGGDMRLWRVRMKPGAPLAFVTLEGRPVFGLPGNPVSTMVTFEQFVRPALLSMMGRREIFRPVERARLAEAYRKPAGRAHFVRVELERGDGSPVARVCADQSSGVLLSMVRADALVFIPEDVTDVPAGAEVPAILLGGDVLSAEPGY